MNMQKWILNILYIQPLCIIHNYPKLNLNPSQSDVKLMPFSFAARSKALKYRQNLESRGMGKKITSRAEEQEQAEG